MSVLLRAGQDAYGKAVVREQSCLCFIQGEWLLGKKFLAACAIAETAKEE